jgi:hypothetical protein
LNTLAEDRQCAADYRKNYYGEQTERENKNTPAFASNTGSSRLMPLALGAYPHPLHAEVPPK